MEDSSSTSVEDLFTSLNRHIEQAEYASAAHVSDQILLTLPGDEDALRCKIIALIENGETAESLSVIRSSRNPHPDFSFYEAYCLYRESKLDDALEILKNRERDNAGAVLEAQILYRLGKTNACLETYEKLRNAKIESLEVNIAAGLISSGKASEVRSAVAAHGVKPTKSFELAYNTACALIGSGEYVGAEKLLLTARRIGQETLTEDDVDADGIEKELSPIAVQLAHVHHLLGRNREALDSYAAILDRNVASRSSIAVAVNNSIAVKGLRDVSDGLRRLESLFMTRGSLDLDRKLSRTEREAICVNRILLMLHSKKIDHVKELLPGMASAFPESEFPVILRAAVLVRENKIGEAEAVLDRFAVEFPESSGAALLTRAQVAAAAGHASVAFDSLSRIPDIRHMPATVATLVALKERVGDAAGAEVVLDSAMKWWSGTTVDGDDGRLLLLMRAAASLKQKHRKDGEAAVIYEKIYEKDRSLEALALLVMTAARGDVEKAEAYEKLLKPLPGLAEIDGELLEKTAGARLREGGRRFVRAMAGSLEGLTTKKKRKRKRKPRYPKGFDPANPGPPPDPERWLPKRERSNYRPKRKDKRSAHLRGSQGSVVREKPESGPTGDGPAGSRPSKASSTTRDPPKSIPKPSKKKFRK